MKLAGQLDNRKIILKQEEMIEFYKYLYVGGFALRTPYDYQKNIPEMESQPNVSSCQANITPVTICWIYSY